MPNKDDVKTTVSTEKEAIEITSKLFEKMGIILRWIKNDNGKFEPVNEVQYHHQFVQLKNEDLNHLIQHAQKPDDKKAKHNAELLAYLMVHSAKNDAFEETLERSGRNEIWSDIEPDVSGRLREYKNAYLNTYSKPAGRADTAFRCRAASFITSEPVPEPVPVPALPVAIILKRGVNYYKKKEEIALRDIDITDIKTVTPKMVKDGIFDKPQSKNVDVGNLFNNPGIVERLKGLISNILKELNPFGSVKKPNP